MVSDRAWRRHLSGMLRLGAGLCLGLLAAFAAPPHAPARAQQLDWAKGAGGKGPDGGTGIATDRHGNSYVTGLFSGTATFGAGEANQTELTARDFGAFVAKYAPDGDLLWARSAGDFAEGFGIATDRVGNGYVSGFFSGTATFGAGEANQTNLTADDFELFVAKYAPDGTLLWARSDGGSGRQEAIGIDVDRHGNSFVVGDFSGTATFGAGEENETEFTTVGRSGIFLVKYAPDGALLWAVSADSTDYAFGNSVATDRDGNSYLTGQFSGTATFGADEANRTVLTAAGGYGNPDVFVAKYAPDGALLWAKSAGGTGADGGDGIAIDPLGNGYVSGFFSAAARFGAGGANQTELTAVGFTDVFVAKYAPDGSLVWAKSAGGMDTDRAIGIATDPCGNSYVTGWFLGWATFGAGEENQTELAVAGLTDALVAGPAREHGLLPRNAGSTRIDLSVAIAVAPRGTSYLLRAPSGTPMSSVREADQIELTAAGYIDAFVAKYAPDGTLLWARSDGGPAFDQGGGIATDGHGNHRVTGTFSGVATFGAGEPNETELIASGEPNADDVDIFVAK